MGRKGKKSEAAADLALKAEIAAMQRKLASRQAGRYAGVGPVSATGHRPMLSKDKDDDWTKIARKPSKPVAWSCCGKSLDKQGASCSREHPADHARCFACNDVKPTSGRMGVPGKPPTPLARKAPPPPASALKKTGTGGAVDPAPAGPAASDAVSNASSGKLRKAVSAAKLLNLTGIPRKVDEGCFQAMYKMPYAMDALPTPSEAIGKILENQPSAKLAELKKDVAWLEQAIALAKLAPAGRDSGLEARQKELDATKAQLVKAESSFVVAAAVSAPRLRELRGKREREEIERHNRALAGATKANERHADNTASIDEAVAALLEHKRLMVLAKETSTAAWQAREDLLVKHAELCLQEVDRLLQEAEPAVMPGAAAASAAVCPLSVEDPDLDMEPALVEDHDLLAPWSAAELPKLTQIGDKELLYLHHLWVNVQEWSQSGVQVPISYGNLFGDPEDVVPYLVALRSVVGDEYWKRIYGTRVVGGTSTVPHQFQVVIMLALSSLLASNPDLALGRQDEGKVADFRKKTRTSFLTRATAFNKSRKKKEETKGK